MKGKITAIMLCSIIALTAGTCVAYYNTKSFGFEDSVEIISKDNEKISFLDFDFYYKDIDDFFKNAKEYLPERPQSIGPKILDNVDVI